MDFAFFGNSFSFLSSSFDLELEPAPAVDSLISTMSNILLAILIQVYLLMWEVFSIHHNLIAIISSQYILLVFVLGDRFKLK